MTDKSYSYEELLAERDKIDQQMQEINEQIKEILPRRLSALERVAFVIAKFGITTDEIVQALADLKKAEAAKERIAKRAAKSSTISAPSASAKKRGRKPGVKKPVKKVVTQKTPDNVSLNADVSAPESLGSPVEAQSGNAMVESAHTTLEI
jgi:chromosome segregation ATPase